jgi:zinc and cadmium transporter
MHPVALLAIYSLICVVASLGGGWVPLVMRLTHRRMQIAISFVSGIILGIGLLHLLPHSFAELRSIDLTVAWVLVGFLFMFFLERFFHFHHHDAPGDSESLDSAALDSSELPVAHEHCDHDHDHSHAHHHHGHEPPRTAFSWLGVAIGLTLHGLIDGLTLAAAVKSEEGHAVALAGIGALLAVALHKPFDSLTIGTLMAAAGKSPFSRHVVNAAYALVTPLGVLLFYTISSSELGWHIGLGQTLGFAAGAFLCIATGDLLPELQFHRHDRLALSAALVAVIALAWGTVFLEAGGHDHFHDHGRSAGGASSHDHNGEHGEHAHGEHHDHPH